MGIMTTRLLLHLHKAVHSLQNMSKPGSTVYMSQRTGPITFKVVRQRGSEEESLGEVDATFHAGMRPGCDSESVIEIRAPSTKRSTLQSDRDRQEIAINAV